MRRTLTFILILTAAFLVACGPEAEEAAEPSDSGPIQGTAVVEETKESDGADDSALEDIKDLFLRKASLEYMVAYDMVSEVDGEVTESKMTQYLDGTRMRFDTETEGVEARMYMEDEKFTTCSNDDSEWICFQMEQQDSVAAQVQEDVEQNIEDYDVDVKAPRVIAGKTALCFDITVEDASVEYCFSKEGVPLYVKTAGSHEGTIFSSEMIATSYSTNVPRDAFDLPAEPMDLGNMDDLLAQYS